MKKIIVSIIVLSLMVLSGCGDNSSSSIEPITTETITTEPIDEDTSKALEIVNLYTPKLPTGTKQDYDALTPTSKYDLDNYINAFMSAIFHACEIDSVVDTSDYHIKLFDDLYNNFSRIKVYRDFYQLSDCHNFYSKYLNYNGSNVVVDDIYKKYIVDMRLILDSIMKTYYE